ncbi:MAG: response regulator [Planctomycetota bacterium]
MADVLLVDDERTVHDLVTRVLEAKMQRECDAVLSGWEALDRLAAGGRYELALVDLHMPDLDGASLVKKMRAAGHDLPVVIISGLPQEEVEAAARELGAVGWVKKPFDVSRLVHECEKALGISDDGDDGVAAGEEG